jgi:hypothetical protein
MASPGVANEGSEVNERDGSVVSHGTGTQEGSTGCGKCQFGEARSPQRLSRRAPRSFTVRLELALRSTVSPSFLRVVKVWCAQTSACGAVALAVASQDRFSLRLSTES